MSNDNAFANIVASTTPNIEIATRFALVATDMPNILWQRSTLCRVNNKLSRYSTKLELENCTSYRKMI